MKRFLVLVAFLALTLAALTPGTALAASDSHTYQLHLEEPNVSEAANGDRVSITGMGVFGVHPKSVAAHGEFTHTNASHAVLASGTWMATELLEYQSYGCGVVLGTPIPPDFCGGALKMRVLMTVTSPGPLHGFQSEGILTVFCIIGPNPPNSHADPSGEGIHLVVPGIANFNKIIEGMNVFIQIT